MKTPLLRFCAACLLSPVIVAMHGCGGREFETATVTGNCTCKGVPMSAGLLIFSPQRNPQTQTGANLGKPAHAIIQPDGSFTMSTYDEEDGAVIGRHRVELNLAAMDDDDPEQPCEFAAGDLFVEVKPGENHLQIELAPSSQPSAVRQ